MQRHFLENMQRIQTNLRLEKRDLESQKEWILDFMSRIDILVMEMEKKNKIAFYCDILFILIISLSGIDCLLPRKQLLITSQEVRMRFFPQAIATLIDRQPWKSMTPQVFENLSFFLPITHITKIFL